MDTMKQMQRTVLPLLMLCGLAACSDDDWKDDVAALQEPTPTSIVIMDNAGGTVVKGNRFQVRFRVNPSGTQLTKDNVELDVQNSDTYFLYEEEGNNAAKTRASYVEPSDYYALESVEPDKNEAGETLDGQWIATIQTQGEANFRNVANLVPPYHPDSEFHGVSSAIEYAVCHLEVKHIIVLGHSNCGGIQTLMSEEWHDHPSEFLKRWLSLAEPARKRVKTQLGGLAAELQLRACEETSILLSMENLMTFPWIRERVEAGKLKIHGWYFNMNEGEMYDYDSEKEEFFPLDDNMEFV